MTLICGSGTRCGKHDAPLHGYPCWDCQQEWERRSPRVRALLRRQVSGKGGMVTPAQIAKARKADADALAEVAADPAFLHITETERGPEVRRPWHVVCRVECGWSSFGHPSRTAARTAGDAHLAEANGARG